MQNKLRILLGISLILMAGCNNPSSDKQEEPTSGQGDSAATQSAVDTTVKVQSLPDTVPVSDTTKKTAQTPTDELSNPANLLGTWFVPHGATINIKFTSDGRFVFNDYNSKLQKDEVLKGTYTLEKGTLTLNYDDRPKQRFKFYKGKKGDDNYYITKEGYYFVKGDDTN